MRWFNNMLVKKIRGIGYCHVPLTGRIGLFIKKAERFDMKPDEKCNISNLSL